MPAAARLADLLPSLWRPEPGDATLLAQWLAAVGEMFDAGATDLQHVLRAHWFDSADAAAWAKHFAADRRERGLGALRPGHTGDRREALRYPYLRDLGRLGALLDLPPWRDPASLREGVEEYRQRIGDILGAYREGLVTPAGLRRLVDAALPEDMSAPLAAQRGRCAIEEPVALRATAIPLVAPQPAQEVDVVAPLARWTAAGTAAPAFVMAGVAPGGLLGATERPMVERYTPGAALKGIGVAYDGLLGDGQALRLAPARRHWLMRGAALAASPVETAGNAARDPSANGPYAAAATLSAGRGSALVMAPDGAPWLIQRESGAAQRVQRFDGSTLQAVAAGAPSAPLHAMAMLGDSAWLGAGAGLFRCRLFAEDGALAWQAVAGVSGAVRGLEVTANGNLIAAGAQGAWLLTPDGAVAGHRHAALDVVGYTHDSRREVIATERALFISCGERVWRYASTGPSEATPDWVEEADPDNTQASPLPPITAIATTPDGSLWLGGPAGLARWFGAPDGTTRLAAFPDVVTGAVHGLACDDRGMLWIGGDDGLFRFDGRDLAQYDFGAARWLPLGDADLAYPEELRSEPRGFWQYDRGTGEWQRFDARAGRFANPALPARAAASEPIGACTMLPALRAETGTWDGSVFTASADVPGASLKLRIKPAEHRIVDGVLPYLPAPVPGSAWRYLQLQPDAQPPGGGGLWWSREGQLFPTPAAPPPPPARTAAVPGHWRDLPAFLTHPQHEGQFGQSAFAYPPSARLTLVQPADPMVGIRVRLFAADPARPVDPAVAARVWQLIARARPAGVPLQLMTEGTLVEETPP